MIANRCLCDALWEIKIKVMFVLRLFGILLGFSFCLKQCPHKAFYSVILVLHYYLCDHYSTWKHQCILDFAFI